MSARHISSEITVLLTLTLGEVEVARLKDILTTDIPLEDEEDREVRESILECLHP